MIDKLHYISQETENISHLDAINKTLIAGAKWIQLRVKNKPENVILELAIKANALCKAYGARLIVNDHPLIALKAGAYGLHLGLTDMPIAEARSIVGGQMIIGGTANTFEHVKQRVAEGADYIGLGPYRFTNTKQNLSPIIGLEGYEAIMKQVSIAGITTPIIAIGGIELNDISLIMTTGVHGVALSGALTNANDPAAELAQMYSALKVLNPINN
ncbi:thiamine phosphate synthase [Pedobacter panaciterrae]|mgnify:CR=1 FL=1|jgi:thiamine-phosphate pyrophosphorylase|uniref:Thiamine-phosphate synthase n=1 Tax=Pedobacter panaciterrae TaxID=363849 RepID=A0ABU8NTC1_9SPHI|nr:thiamine phosphate synthase [Pedobacter panaciterrae]NQX53397.1 thiamine phosphate synthase [Pedobacter panaciterrae]